MAKKARKLENTGILTVFIVYQSVLLDVIIVANPFF